MTSIQDIFLANFADGDSWEEADALSLTKHGGLEVAKFFYELGRNEKMDKNGHKVDAGGRIVFDEICTNCDAPKDYGL